MRLFGTSHNFEHKKPIKNISSTALKKLQTYHWPGNIRELRHLLERAVILAESSILQPSDFFFPEAAQALDQLAFETYNLEDVEKTVIRKVLTKHHGNVTQTAKELGVTRTSLYRRMEKYGL